MAHNINYICSNCHKSINTENDENCNKTVEKCQNWLEKCNLSDDSLQCVENLSCSDSDSTADTAATDTFDDNEAVTANETVYFGDNIVARNNDRIIWDNIAPKTPNQYKDIKVYKSRNVHIGNVTNIYGPVYINEFAPKIQQNIIIDNNRGFPIVSRMTWLAQPPIDPQDVKYLTEPAKFVIINHSAAQEAYTQTDNNLLVRLIQQFHIESRKWNDISYNFLAGADGSIYEGRGWNVVGAHTLGYNSNSIGICFIGYYSRDLPPKGVLQKVKDLIKYGVEIGAISENYSLLGHCQCRSSESPGQKLYDELKTWDHWDESVSVLDPSPFMVK